MVTVSETFKAVNGFPARGKVSFRPAVSAANLIPEPGRVVTGETYVIPLDYKGP